MTENRERWSFAIYEILDRRNSPRDPAVLHTAYRGVVELAATEIPDPAEATFTAKLEEAVVRKWRALQHPPK